jgi:GntR family transcriptional repressor for pyruvate dehydrogenase complex
MKARAPDELLFAPVRPKTAFDETLGRLENAIKLGLLAPGSQLPAERDLCAQLGISRSTLRQALMTLTQSGYLHATRGRGGGTFVVDQPPPTPVPPLAQLQAWREACNERLAIELGVVALAAERATDETIAPLADVADRMAALDDYDRYCQVDRRLHIAIAELTGSRMLILATTRVQAAIADLLAAVQEPGDSLRRSANAHKTLLEALAANDENAALKAMCSHLQDTVALLERELDGQTPNQPAL